MESIWDCKEPCSGGHRAWGEGSLDIQGKGSPSRPYPGTFLLYPSTLPPFPGTYPPLCNKNNASGVETMSLPASWAVLSESKARAFRDGGLGGCNVRPKEGILSIAPDDGLLHTLLPAAPALGTALSGSI